MTYYLQLKNSRIWEEVSVYVYKNWNKCLDRYSGNRIIMNDTGIQVECLTPLDKHDWAIITRLFGATEKHYPSISNGGLIHKPEMVKMKIGQSVVMHEIATGNNWRLTNRSPKGSRGAGEKLTPAFSAT